MYPSSSLLGNHKDESIAGLPVEELIEKADGFAGVFPGMCLCVCFLSFILIQYIVSKFISKVTRIREFTLFLASVQSTNMKL